MLPPLTHIAGFLLRVFVLQVLQIVLGIGVAGFEKMPFQGIWLIFMEAVNFSNHFIGSTFSCKMFAQGCNYLVEVVDLLQLCYKIHCG